MIAALSAAAFAMLAIGTLTVLHAQLATSAWPMFHYNLTHTGLSPYSTSANPGTEKWTFLTGGAVYSSPAVGTDGTIYVGSDDAYLYAVNPNGTQKWKFLTGNSVQCSPAIGSDGTVYFGSYDHRLYAVNPNGTQKWAFLTGGAVLCSPAVSADGTIYVGSNEGFLHALTDNGTSATQKWAFGIGGEVGDPAVGADGTIYPGFPLSKCTTNVVRPSGAIDRRGFGSDQGWCGGEQPVGEDKSGPFQLSFNSSLRVDFQGARVTSDGGLILVRELDERLGLSELIEQYLADSRGKNAQIPLADLLRQSVYSRLAGYEDLNDAERLSQDPAFRLIGSRKIWERGAALTSRLQSFETELLTQEDNLAGLAALNRQLVAKAEAIDSPRRIVLDMDSTEIPVYGE